MVVFCAYQYSRVDAVGGGRERGVHGGEKRVSLSLDVVLVTKQKVDPLVS